MQSDSHPSPLKNMKTHVVEDGKEGCIGKEYFQIQQCIYLPNGFKKINYNLSLQVHESDRTVISRIRRMKSAFIRLRRFLTISYTPNKMSEPLKTDSINLLSFVYQVHVAGRLAHRSRTL